MKRGLNFFTHIYRDTNLRNYFFFVSLVSEMKNIKSNNPNSIQEAYRYLANAKQTLANSPIEYGIYTDSKYVSEAAGIAYLSALKAINIFLLSRGMQEKEFPQSIEGYRDMIRNKMPHNGKLMAALHIAYQNLHLFGCYRGGTDVKMIKSGLENCKKIIEMIDKTLGQSASHSMVSEPQEIYLTGKSKK